MEAKQQLEMRNCTYRETDDIIQLQFKSHIIASQL